MNGSKPTTPPLLLCYSYYAAGGIENNTFLFNSDVEQGNYAYIVQVQAGTAIHLTYIKLLLLIY